MYLQEGSKNMHFKILDFERVFFGICIIVGLFFWTGKSDCQDNKKEQQTLLKVDESQTIRERMVKSIMMNLEFCKLRSDRQGIITPSCAKTPEGCETRIRLYVEYILQAAYAQDLDPWLLSALFFNESRFNPWAVGAIGERGIAQINPRTKRGKRLKFVKSPWFRKRCTKIPGECQETIVMEAAKHLRAAIDNCGGDVILGMSMYNSGRCELRNKYVKNVFRYKMAFEEGEQAKDIRYCDQKNKKNNFKRKYRIRIRKKGRYYEVIRLQK